MKNPIVVIAIDTDVATNAEVCLSPRRKSHDAESTPAATAKIITPTDCDKASVSNIVANINAMYASQAAAPKHFPLRLSSSNNLSSASRIIKNVTP